ncbi:MAG: RNA polymerase sigma factor RpoD/SigA [Bacteroidales bacterium]|nr:RNA polymerase sigma factor RpoD/SigA [Bacteroidales bacterium]
MKNLQIKSRITPRSSSTIDIYLKEIAQLPLLTLHEECELTQRIHTGDERALERMVEGNLRFVVSVAKNYQKMGLELEDLISAGNMGLITAAKRFDETRGFRFCSYAVWWIRQSILQAISKEGRTVSLPANQLSLLSKMGRESSRLEQELQRPPTSAEVTERLEANEEHVRWLLHTSERPVSLDAPVLGDEGSIRIETIADNSSRTDESLITESLQTEIQSVLNILSKTEQSILRMSFGIGQPYPNSLEEIATKMNLSRERVRQIQVKAITRLRRSPHREKLRLYL